MTGWLTLSLFVVSSLALVNGLGAIIVPLAIHRAPVSWHYHHYRRRIPVALVLVAVGGALTWSIARTDGALPGSAWPALLLLLLGLVTSVRLHQSKAFPAIDFPSMASEPRALPLAVDDELAVVEYGGVTKAYPLDFVIHHHIVNDRFGDRLVALTYCAMCRTIIAFDVSEIGPLFVGSFRRGNMIVADRETGTFFQQATFASLIGPLHPRTLEMVWSQQLTWAQVQALDPMPEVAAITAEDLRPFELPIPGVWKHIVAGETVPGLHPSEKNTELPARTRVVAVLGEPPEAFVEREVHDAGFVSTRRGFLVSVDGSILGFGASLEEPPGEGPLDDGPLDDGPLDDGLLDLALADGALVDGKSGRRWDLLGRALDGGEPLPRLTLSREYWFSWKLFHPHAPLRRLPDDPDPTS